jgi:hypothetical protein
MSSAVTTPPARVRSEQAALQQLIGRLVEQFPEVAEDEIVSAVHGRYADFDGSPVRDFIPVLVERSARQDITSRLQR